MFPLLAAWACFHLALPAFAAPEKPRLLASFLPIYCFAANVAGDSAKVDALVPGGLTPHDYQFSPRDIEKVKTADLLLLNGLGLEPWKDRLERNARPKALAEVAAGFEDQLIHGQLHGGAKNDLDGHNRDEANPHVWLDPRLATHCVSNVAAALCRVHPARAPIYTANAAAYTERLRLLDSEIAIGLRLHDGAAIITYHDAFAYFARRYGLKVVGVIELVPEVNPSARHLAELRRTAREQNVKVLFIEAGVRSRAAQQIAADLNLAVAPLDTLETGPLRPSAYEDGMRSNLATLKRVLR